MKGKMRQPGTMTVYLKKAKEQKDYLPVLLPMLFHSILFYLGQM